LEVQTLHQYYRKCIIRGTCITPSAACNLFRFYLFVWLFYTIFFSEKSEEMFQGEKHEEKSNICNISQNIKISYPFLQSGEYNSLYSTKKDR